MTRLRIITDDNYWCIHQRAVALARYSPPGWGVSIDQWSPPHHGLRGGPFDLVLCLPVGRVENVAAVMRVFMPSAPLVAEWNTELPRWTELFHRVRSCADAVAVNNRPTWQRIPESIRQADNLAYLPDGYDDSTFYARDDNRMPCVLWSGGVLGTNADRDAVKGYSRFILPLAERLRKLAIPTSFIPVDPHGPHVRTPAQMAEWYNSGTVYVCASKYEGAANACVEAAACGCQIVTTPVGEAQYIPNAIVVARRIDDLYEGVVHSLAHPVRHSVKPWAWAHRAPAFYRYFEEVLDEHK